MSEDRRKRQQERAGITDNRKRKNVLVYGGIVVVLAAAYYAGWHRKNHKYDAFAQCLSSKQAKMFGLSWCPHCVEQKEMFGEAFHYVHYEECGIVETHEETPACKIQGIKLFPSWQFGTDPPREGVLSMESLSERTGCSLP